jgi:hypothetical protein
MSPEASFVATDAQIIIPESDPPFPTITELTTTRRAPRRLCLAGGCPQERRRPHLDPARVSSMASRGQRKKMHGGRRSHFNRMAPDPSVPLRPLRPLTGGPRLAGG